MSLDRIIFLFAGSFILVSILLAHFVSPHFLWATVFVGANLLQASLTGFCPLATILKRVGIRPGQAFD
ncbi:MAG: DUF2892 domain-containing protein [Deltaproteobacteria bacterium]|nr:DUF2892 domain-containing protein [Deltaproteobacteria bacterium]